MAGLNKILLIGNLGADPEVRTIQSGSKVAKMTLAVTEKYKNKSGETVSNTEWFDLEAWEGLAEIAEKWLKKGSQVHIEGKQKTEKWETETGDKRSRKIVRVVNFIMLGGNPQNGNQQQKPQHNSMNSDAGPDLVLDDSDDDLPF